MQLNTQQNTFFWLRNILVISQILLWLMAKYIWELKYPISVIYLSMGYLLLNLTIKYFYKSLTNRQLFLNLLVDVAQLSIFFYLTGGASNPFTWFLIVPIFFSATVLSPKYTWTITGFSVLSYTLLIKYFQPISNDKMVGMDHHMDHSTSFGQHIIGMWLGFIVLSFLISWFISGLMKNIRLKEALLIQAKSKQAENEKILALATLATGSAHELGTPLATINIIIKDLINDESIKQHHNVLNIAASQINRCKESLTNITASTGTTQAVNGKVISVNGFLENIHNRIIDPRSDKIRLNINHNKIDKLHSDQTLIQALVNIINNALESQATSIIITTKIINHQLRINIADNGEGLSNDFELIKHSEKEFGMGLGLFLSKTTIERFSGRINLIKSDKTGTELQIDLPLHEQEK